MRMMKTLWLLCAAALVLGLTGCGGSSATRAPAPAAASVAAPQPTPEQTLDERLAAAKTSLEEAEAELARLQADPSATTAQIADAMTAVEEAQAAVTSLNQQIATRDGQLPLTLDGKALRTALDPKDDQGAPALPAFEDFFTVAHGGEVTAAALDTVATDDLDTKFEKSSSVLAPNLTSEGEGWTGSVYARSKKTAGGGTPGADDDVTLRDMVTVYTDMEDPTYAQHYYNTYYDMAEMDPENWTVG